MADSTELKTSSKATDALSSSNPHNQIVTNEPHSIQITTIKLNGANFLHWSQSVQMYIRGRGKMGYLTGSNKALQVGNPGYDKWDAKNSMVMT